jgi:hypothetical protein
MGIMSWVGPTMAGRIVGAAILVALVSAGCQSSTTPAPPTPSPSPSPSDSVVVAPTTSVGPTGSASPSAGPSVASVASADPCKIFTVDDASALLGVTLTKTQGGTVGQGGQNCVYSSGPSTHVTVFDRTAASPAAIDAVFAAIEGQSLAAPGVTGSKISDIGEGAFESRDAGTGGKTLAVIAFVRGSTYVSLTAYPGPSDGKLHDAAALALSRL